MELLVDSGAVASIMNYRTYKALRPTPRLEKLKTELTSYTGQAITVRGQTKASVICGNTRILDFDFVVVDEGELICLTHSGSRFNRPLIGQRETLKRFSAVKRASIF